MIHGKELYLHSFHDFGQRSRVIPIKVIWSEQEITVWRGTITSKLEERFLFLFSAHHLMMIYICINVHEEIFKGFKDIERPRNITLWPCVLTLTIIRQGSDEFCTSPWYGEHLTKVFIKILRAIKEIWSGHEKLMDRQTDGERTTSEHNTSCILTGV